MLDMQEFQQGDGVPSELSKALEEIARSNHQAAQLLLRLKIKGPSRINALRALRSARYLEEALEGALTEDASV